MTRFRPPIRHSRIGGRLTSRDPFCQRPDPNRDRARPLMEISRGDQPGWDQVRTLTARATTRATVLRAMSDWASISSLAQRVRGMVSVGLKALVDDTYR
jgi:hypothetical protein